MTATISRDRAIEAACAPKAALASYDALSESDAAEFVDAMIAATVERLRRDPRWANLSRYDLDLTLADLRRQFTDRLAHLIDDRVPAREITREYCYALDDETAGGDA